MKSIKTLILLLLITIFSCKTEVKIETERRPIETIEAEINTVLDTWHKAAAQANFDDYFNAMTTDGIFIGTDPTENWNLKDFKAFSKPYFDKGKAWSFTAVERNVFIYEDQKMVWFDELLDTQMKLCRGSGVMKFENNEWKVAHYVLSIAIPNENVSKVVELKTAFDDKLLETIQSK